MAENKKSFILYADLLHTVQKLPPEKAGELFLTILRYVNDEDPVVEDLLVEVAFEPVRQQLKRDLQKWDDFRKKQSENGKRGGRPPKGSLTDENPNNPSLLLESQKSLNANVNVNANVNANVRENTSPLAGSNLFRQPTIPTLQHVEEIFARAGGSAQMAKSFFEKHESTGWFLNGSPITNLQALATRFIQNWKDNDTRKNLTTFGARRREDASAPGTIREPL